MWRGEGEEGRAREGGKRGRWRGGERRALSKRRVISLAMTSNTIQPTSDESVSLEPRASLLSPSDFTICHFRNRSLTPEGIIREDLPSNDPRIQRSARTDDQRRNGWQSCFRSLFSLVSFPRFRNFSTNFCSHTRRISFKNLFRFAKVWEIRNLYVSNRRLKSIDIQLLYKRTFIRVQQR